MPLEVIVAIIAIVAIGIVLFIAVVRINRKSYLPHPDEEKGVVSKPLYERDLSAKNVVAISEIESLILKNGDGHELALTRPNMVQNAEKQYREIIVRGSSAVGQVAQGAMPILAKAQTLAQIAKAAPEGIFTATGSVQDLMRYSDGTVASFIRKGNQFGTHSGFSEVAISAANPAAVIGGAMQAMAMVSGQYYMNEISGQFNKIDKKLDKLIGYHHDEKVGILKYTNQKLYELTSNTNVDAADIIACQRLAEKCGEVYFEYKTRLDGVSIDAKERWFNKSKELRELGESIDDSELNFTIQMCYQASELYEKCKLAEITVRMKIGNGQERFITEKIASISDGNSMAFHRNIRQYIDKHYVPVLEKATKIAEAKKISLLSGDTTAETENVQRRRNQLLEIVADENIDLTESLLHSLNDSKEVLIIQSESPENQRVFVLEE